MTETVNVLVIGAGAEATAIARELMADSSPQVRVVGFVDECTAPGTSVVDGATVVGGPEDLSRLVDTLGIRELVVVPSEIGQEAPFELLQSYAEDDRYRIRLSTGLRQRVNGCAEEGVVPAPRLVTLNRCRGVHAEALAKAALDRLGALGGLVVLSPLLFLIALAVRRDSAGPAIHRRLVLGRGGTPFFALKFRTMVANADDLLAADAALQDAFAAGHKLKVDPRVTRVGAFLRRTSLDELPQLWNVLVGQMSLVGPRMITPEESPRYGPWRLNLLTVKPGITGPWQVEGRSDIPYEERVRLSMDYIRDYSFWLDLRILWRTVGVVFGREGAY